MGKRESACLVFPWVMAESATLFYLRLMRGRLSLWKSLTKPIRYILVNCPSTTLIPTVLFLCKYELVKKKAYQIYWSMWKEKNRWC